jgi:hypothetical protein
MSLTKASYSMITGAQVNVLDFGADRTGVSNSTTKFQAAIDSLPANGGTVYVPSGTYLLDTIEFPVQPKTVNLIGESMWSVILRMNTAAGPILKKKAVSGVIFGGILANFTIQANALSDRSNLAHQGAFLSGWYHSKFINLKYMCSSDSTSVSGSVGIFLNLTGSPYASYDNTFEGIEVIGQYGPSRCISFGNNGTTVFNNPNVVEVRDSTFYVLPATDVAIHGADVTRMNVRNCLFEVMAIGTGVIMGQNSLIDGNWFELLGRNVTTSAIGTTDGSASTVISNYMSDGLSTIEAIGVKPLWIGNAGAGGGNPLNINGAGGVQRIEASGTTPAGPVLTGGSGTFTLVYSAAVSPIDQTNRVSYKTAYSHTPTATGVETLTIGAITGYVLETCVVSCARDSTGTPELTAVDINNSVIGINYATNDIHSIYMQSTWRRL